MIIEIDFGNSRIKWRCLESANGTATIHHAASLSGMLAKLENCEKPQAIRIASVRNSEEVNEFKDWVSDRWQLELLIAKTSRYCAGVSNSYEDESRMGVDRWLAMLSSYNRAQGACIVVDGGTALTVDVLNADGNHDGGFILPGLKLMAQALESNTAIRLRPQTDEPGIEPGKSTEQAVHNAALASAVALVEITYSRLRASNSTVKIFLSGGDAPLLSASLEVLGDVEILPDLVLDGLALACPIYEPEEAGIRVEAEG